MILTDKIIIRNYTDLSNERVLYYVYQVIIKGEISELDNGEHQYCFATRFNSGYVVTCAKKGHTYTFKVILDTMQKISKKN